MNAIQIFRNEEFGAIRTLEINGQIYFVGKDVAKALGYVNTKDAINVHVAEEDKMVLSKRFYCEFLRSQNTTLENFPNRGLTIINESGLYSLILSSELPDAKKFKHWVTSEVLPEIRRTGTYGISNIEGVISKVIDEKMEEIVNRALDKKLKDIVEISNWKIENTVNKAFDKKFKPFAKSFNKKLRTLAKASDKNSERIIIDTVSKNTLSMVPYFDTMDKMVWALCNRLLQYDETKRIRRKR